MRARQLLAFSLLALIWGTTWLAIKFVVREMPPMTAAGLRFALGAAVLGAIARGRGRRLDWRGLASGDRRVLLALSVLMFAVPYSLIFYGEQFITSALTAILFSSAPAFTLLFDSLRSRRNQVSGARLGGLLLAFGGVLVIFVPRLAGPPAELLGAVAVVGAAAVSSWGLVLAKYRAHDIDTLVGTTWQMAFGSLWLLLAGVAIERPEITGYSASALLGLLYLAVFGSCVAFLLFYGLLKQMAAVQLSSLAFITPLVALFAGWLLLSERLALYTLAGAAAVLAGVALLHRPRPLDSARDKPEPVPAGD